MVRRSLTALATLTFAGLSGCGEPEDNHFGRAEVAAKFRSVSIGMTPAQVESRIGKPDDSRNGGPFIVGGPEGPTVVCSVYDPPSVSWFYEVCFTSGRSTYKAIHGRPII